MLDTLEHLEAVGSDASLRYLQARDMVQHFAAAGASALSIAAASDNPRKALGAEFGGERNREPNLVDHVFIEAMDAEMASDLKVNRVSG